MYNRRLIHVCVLFINGCHSDDVGARMINPLLVLCLSVYVFDFSSSTIHFCMSSSSKLQKQVLYFLYGTCLHIYVSCLVAVVRACMYKEN
jgi:hypothetical protein